MSETLEALAEEGANATFTERILEAQRGVARLVRCAFCGGHGQDPSKWAGLWGGACWVCGGWGSRKEGPFCLRGPLAPHPNR